MSLYKYFAPLEKCPDYIYLKCGENPKRDEFLIFLKKNNLHSWITNIQNGSPSMELYLFESDNSKFVKFLDYDNNPSKEIDNSNKIIIDSI